MASSTSWRPRRFSLIELSQGSRPVEESPKEYDVFINHRGPDVKETLALQLYETLSKESVQSFLDSEEKKIGLSFPSTIETAIRSAAVHIAIFSQTYAESAWCLEELVSMLETKALIIPVFYGDVQPSDLRYVENGKYAYAFKTHKDRGRYEEEKLKAWEEALEKVSYIAGFLSKNYKDDNLCETIVTEVKKELLRKQPEYVAEHPVGLEELEENFERFCQEGKVKERANILGIVGMGGIGKSTLARALFNRKRSEYHEACFLANVREADKMGKLPSLQNKLLKDLLRENHREFGCREDGITYLKNRFKSQDKCFLIILDDIDHLDQLEAFPVLEELGSSLAIVTTRDEGVLINFRISIRYKLKTMNLCHGSQLLCLHAFKTPHPSNEYKEVVKAFVDACRGLPLYLRVLGRHISGRNVDECWQDLNKYKSLLHGDIKDSLKISLERLDPEEENLFMDMACFFVDKPKSVAIRVWEGSGWNAHSALRKLEEKGLVEEIDYRWNYMEPVLRMHDLLRDLGREKAKDPQFPRRLWNPIHLRNLESMGFKKILDRSASDNFRCFHSMEDRSMDAKITYFLANSDGWIPEPASLLWLELDFNRQQLECIPPWIPLKKLEFLKIMKGDLKRLWQNDEQVPSCLKSLQLSQTIFVEGPDLFGKSSLLENISVSVDDMTVEGWSFLESLILNPSCLVLGPSKLSVELASGRSGEPTTFKSLSSCIYNFSKKFRLRGILDLNNRGQSFTVRCPMSSLQKLEIVGQHLVTKVLVSGYHYPDIKSLVLKSMEGLIELDFKMVTSLNNLELTNCKNLKIVSGISGLSNIVTLHINKCSELEVMPCLAQLSCLQTVTICRCEKLNFLEFAECKNLKSVEICFLSKLVAFSVRHCPELESLQNLAGLNCLQRITIDGCGKLKSLQLCFLNNLKSVKGIVDLTGLEIIKCPELREFPNLASLEKLTIKLQDTADIGELPTLRNLQLLQCSNAFTRNFTHKLQRVPSEYMVAIGSGVDGAESTLRPDLFSDFIGEDAIIQINVQESDLNFKLKSQVEEGLLAGIIVCTVVAVNSAAAPEFLQIGPCRGPYQRLGRGEWIVITAINDQELMRRYLDDFKSFHLKTLLNRSVLEKVCVVTVKKGEESKTLPLVKTIVNRLLKK